VVFGSAATAAAASKASAIEGCAVMTGGASGSTVDAFQSGNAGNLKPDFPD
jgi:hypothetical protein